MISNGDSEEEDHHMVTGANRQLHRQRSQNPKSLNDTTEFHADRNTTTSTTKPLDPVNQIALAIKRLAKNSQPPLFTQKTHYLLIGKTRKTRNSNTLMTYFRQL